MASTSNSKNAPSAFASLLRRSRFVSYDPRIAQIYTTYDGHAHRGNWGLKRPLALRRKSGDFVVFKAVDSNEQQTEWYHAEREARWLRSASEFGKEVDVREDNSPWCLRMGQRWQKTYDSDYNFDPARHSRFGPNILANEFQSSEWSSTDHNRIHTAHNPNPISMNPAQFRRYLAQIRRLRPQFKLLVDAEMEYYANPPASAPAHHHRPDLNYINVAHERFHLISRFFGGLSQTSRSFTKPGSTSLHASPHHNAGLSYSHTSDLTNKFLHGPLPGRIFTEVLSKGKNKKGDEIVGMIAGVAGHLGKVTTYDALDRRATKLSDHEGHLTPVEFRPKAVVLSGAPNVVGTPIDNTGFNTVNVQLNLVEDVKLRSQMTNPYRPGSQAYVAHDDPHGQRGTKTRVAMASKSQKRAGQKRLKGVHSKGTPAPAPPAQHFKQHQVALDEMLANVDKSNVKIDLP